MEVTEKYEFKFTYEMANRNIFLFLYTQKTKALTFIYPCHRYLSLSTVEKQADLTYLLLTFCTVKSQCK